MAITQALRPELAPFFVHQHNAIVDFAFDHQDTWIDGGFTDRVHPMMLQRYTWFLKANGKAGHAAFNQLLGLIDPILLHAAGLTLHECMINYYNADHHLTFHADMVREPNITQVYVTDLVLPGRLDFQLDPQWVGVSTDFNSDGDAFHNREDKNRVDASIDMKPGETVWWSKAAEEAGWFHGGNFDAGRMSLVCRFGE